MFNIGDKVRDIAGNSYDPTAYTVTWAGTRPINGIDIPYIKVSPGMITSALQLRPRHLVSQPASEFVRLYSFSLWYTIASSGRGGLQDTFRKTRRVSMYAETSVHAIIISLKNLKITDISSEVTSWDLYDDSDVIVTSWRKYPPG